MVCENIEETCFVVFESQQGNVLLRECPEATPNNALGLWGHFPTCSPEPTFACSDPEKGEWVEQYQLRGLTRILIGKRWESAELEAA